MFVTTDPVANKAGRTDVKGCCFWGRGALMTKGVCMLGKLNHWLGKKAHDEGRPALYPDIDFCQNPEHICNSIKRNPKIVWDIAFFEWIERIQSYDDGDFNYIEALNKFVEGGMHDGLSFMNAVSKILTEGSANGEDKVPFSSQRLSHFNLLMDHLQLKGQQPQLKDSSPALFVWNSCLRQQKSGILSWLLLLFGSLFQLCRH